MNIEDKLKKDELQKIQNYLQDSKKNVDKLKQGKRPKRKLTYFIQDNKRWVIFFSVLLVTTPFLAFLYQPTQDLINPYTDTILDTIDTLDANFTTESGLPVYELVSENTSSELIILSTLINSMLVECELIPKEDPILHTISFIQQIMENNSFVNYNERTSKLSAFYQFLGIYALLQAYYVLFNSSYEISLNTIDLVINSTLNNFLKYNIWSYFYVVSEATNTTYLADQALAISVLTTYMLLTGDQEMLSWNLKMVVQSLMDRIESRFYIPYSQSFYHEYDYKISISSDLSTSKDLMFTALSLSRMEKYVANFYFPVSSSNVHQKVITELVDSNWLVHEINKTDATILIENQAFFSMVSQLMNFNIVGNEIRNATMTHFYTTGGFVADRILSDVTPESCLYGLLAIISADWSSIENNREINVEPRTYPTTTHYPGETSAMNLQLTLVTLIITGVILRALIQFRKKRRYGDQGGI